MAHLRLLHTRKNDHGFTVSISLQEITMQVVYIYNAVGNNTFRLQHITVPLYSVPTLPHGLCSVCVVPSKPSISPLPRISVSRYYHGHAPLCDCIEANVHPARSQTPLCHNRAHGTAKQPSMYPHHEHSSSDLLSSISATKLTLSEPRRCHPFSDSNTHSDALLIITRSMSRPLHRGS